MRTALLALLITGCTAAGSPRVPTPTTIAELEAARSRDPAGLDPRLHLAAARAATGRDGEAAELLLPELEDADPDPAALFLLGLSLEKESRFAEARRAFEAYLAVDGPLPLRRKALGRIALLERKEMEQAVRDAIAREAELGATTVRDDALGIFPFLVSTSDTNLAPLSRAVAELLATDLAQTNRLTVVERARVQFLLDELRLAASGAVDPATGSRAGRLVSAGRIVQGRVADSGTGLRLEALVVRVATGDRAPPLTEDGALEGLFDMQKQLALQIYSAAGVQLTDAERARVLLRHSDNLQALLAFGSGLLEDDGNRYRPAVSEFARALELDSGFELARFWRERSELKAEAEEEDLDELTGLGEIELGWWLPEWLRRRLIFASIDPLVPDPDLRNPGPETLGVEGLDRRAGVDVVIRPPGGGR
jgi:TolB-like protein